MTTSFYFIVVLCLTSGLWTRASAQDEDDDEGEEEEGPDGCCKSCPDGWTTNDKKCYKFHFAKKNWGDAERFCTTIGGNLAALHNDAVHGFLREAIFRVTGAHTNTWLGGHDAAQEGVWMWSDGSKFDFKGWPKVEPNNHGGKEHCMEMNFLEKEYINDVGCEKEKSFVCARDMEKSAE